ncbi:hypothetical protein COO60DRAFT_1138519 [Scenedesmus sp. NREL 46B-D3]|nr:hypothetical protein COO60DRAFT_1138519 [Scenedesmus sp. NREL 46B-D3]
MPALVAAGASACSPHAHQREQGAAVHIKWPVDLSRQPRHQQHNLTCSSGGATMRQHSSKHVLAGVPASSQQVNQGYCCVFEHHLHVHGTPASHAYHVLFKCFRLYMHIMCFLHAYTRYNPNRAWLCGVALVWLLRQLTCQGNLIILCRSAFALPAQASPPLRGC